MDRNRGFKVLGVFAFALLVMSLAPSYASAEVYEGKFTLPFQARWCGLVLPVGDYTFNLDRLTSTGKIVVRHAGKIVGLVMVGSVASYDSPGESRLDAVPIGETYRIRSIRLHDVCVMNFPAPRKARPVPVSEFELSALVPIAGSGK